VSPDCAWPRLLGERWTGGRRAWVHRDRTTAAPVIHLRGRTYDEWFGSRPRGFREEARRRRRRLEERGAAFRMASGEGDRERGLRAFARLHYARWRERGGTKALDPKVESLLLDAASALDPTRFRLWTIEAGDDVVSAHIFLAAGGEVSYWLGGFDERWAAFAPANLTIMEALRHAFESGDARMDLGGGDQDYKRRLADDADLLQWWTVVPPGPRSAMTRLGLTPQSAYRGIANRVPSGVKQRIDRAVRRLRRPG
jgi:CelD/BcsL family acetyltransferase involved in cellulose biosynthesis